MNIYKKNIYRRIVSVFIILFITMFSSSHAAEYSKGVNAYINGDYSTAILEWTTLAKQGNGKAQCDLAFIYSKGQGVQQDLVKSYAWYYIAASNGNEAAMKSMDIISQKMSSGQITMAMKLSKQLSRKIQSNQ